MYTKEEIKKEISNIRKEIGHEDVEIEIKELHQENNELTIITPDRPEKSIIIGKGGWVVGKLKEKLGLKSIHVISYTDIMLKKYHLKLSAKHLDNLLTQNKIPENHTEAFTNLLKLLKAKEEKPYNNSIITKYIEKNINREYNKNATAIVALSGGSDSSFSTILARSLGFKVKAITVDPGTIILPKQFRYNIDNLANKIGIKHEYIETNMNEIIEDALNGKIHPCGRCSQNIHQTIESQLEKENTRVMIFGDLLSTGTQAIMLNNDKTRINLPALMRMEKTEIKNIITKYDVKKIKGYGCPLLVQVHKKYPQYRGFSIQRVLRETRAGILEPGEALELIKTI
ncbi:MAG: hypothetical protein BZ138_01100 [Methanosphaera sp. rholeuAM270]|nr:MAG: hypothetical protein BZ138_01100 [Methanosphaera sp. rholeuAM270]